MRVALYARVSRKGNGQETRNQLDQLRDYCHRRGHRIVGAFVDNQSGGDANREQFRRLFLLASQGQFDLVLFWALDRFSREGVLETLRHLETLNAYGVEWKSFTEQYLDSAGIFKDAIIGIMATLAKQERIKISERTLAGLEIARAKGKHIGRPQKVFDRAEAVAMRRRGDSFGTIAKRFGISRTTALRVSREAGL